MSDGGQWSKALPPRRKVIQGWGAGAGTPLQPTRQSGGVSYAPSLAENDISAVLSVIECYSFLISHVSGSVCSWLSAWVHESVGAENIVKIVSQNQRSEFHPILVTYVFGFTDMLVRFCGRKLKGHGYSSRWPRKQCERNIFVTTGANFTKIRSHMCLNQETYWLGFQVKRSKVKVTAGEAITVDSSPLSSI